MAEHGPGSGGDDISPTRHPANQISQCDDNIHLHVSDGSSCQVQNVNQSCVSAGHCDEKNLCKGPKRGDWKHPEVENQDMMEGTTGPENDWLRPDHERKDPHELTNRVDLGMQEMELGEGMVVLEILSLALSQAEHNSTARARKHHSQS